jgi:hypothetical protein
MVKVIEGVRHMLKMDRLVWIGKLVVKIMKQWELYRTLTFAEIQQKTQITQYIAGLIRTLNKSVSLKRNTKKCLMGKSVMQHQLLEQRHLMLQFRHVGTNANERPLVLSLYSKPKNSLEFAPFILPLVLKKITLTFLNTNC